MVEMMVKGPKNLSVVNDRGIQFTEIDSIEQPEVLVTADGDSEDGDMRMEVKNNSQHSL